jgi:heat shock protein HslJ
MKLFFLHLFLLLSFTAVMADNSADQKSDVSITNTYWKLLDIKGVSVTLCENLKEPYFILKNDHKVAGFGGCNRFFGNYKVTPTQISLGAMAMTRMMCKGTMELEQNFQKVLQEATHYKIHGENLQLFSNNQLLASFRAVYF